MNRKQRRADNKTAPAQAVSSAEDFLYTAALEHYQGQRTAMAERTLRQLLALNPRHAPSLVLLAILALDAQNFPAAIEFCRLAIAIAPNNAEAHCNLGNAHHHQAKYLESLPHLRRSVRINPNRFEAQVSLGNTLRALGQLDEAIAAYRKATSLQPQSADAHNTLAMALLAKGDFGAGWQEYEFRWQTPQLFPARPQYAEPQWHGQAAPGKTLLIHDEQGFGDTLQFCRLASLAADRGLRVILTAAPALIALLKSLRGIDHLIPRGEPVPAFDLYCPMMSLPLALGITIDTIPAPIPYLHADPQIIADFRARLGPTTCKRIGLVWAGNPRKGQRLLTLVDSRRSIDAALLAPLFEVPGLEFISLQKDGPAAPAHFPLIDLMPAIHDFAGTAALIANLDLVICVDTSVAHLAGALGKPVWLLDRYDHCWRWLNGRRDSPWYPNLRIYRQPRPHDWLSVIQQVAQDLQSFAQEPASP